MLPTPGYGPFQIDWRRCRHRITSSFHDRAYVVLKEIN